MGKLFWIICMGFKSNHMYLYKRGAERDLLQTDEVHWILEGDVPRMHTNDGAKRDRYRARVDAVVCCPPMTCCYSSC